MNNETCIHGGNSPVSLLASLHHSQAGSGRHKCPTCAYEHGFSLAGTGRWKTYEEYSQSISDAEVCQEGSIAPTSILISLGDNQGGTGRHKCTNCAFKEGFIAGLSGEKKVEGVSLQLVDKPQLEKWKQKLPSKPSKETDFIEKELRNKRLGLLGELCVLESEKQYLIENGREDLSKRVEHTSKEVGDGLGYDILSYTLDEKEKYIEVKTTRADINRSFYLTSNELKCSENKKENYYLFRLFDFNSNKNAAKFYLLKGDLNEILEMKPTLFLALPK